MRLAGGQAKMRIVAGLRPVGALREKNMPISITDPYSGASVPFDTSPPAPGTTTNDPGSLLVISVPADDIEIDLGAATPGSNGDVGIRMKTDTHAHIVVGSPQTSISLGASPSEDLGGGIGAPGLAIFTNGQAAVTSGFRTEQINGDWNVTVTGDNNVNVLGDGKWNQTGNWNGMIVGFTEDAVLGEHLELHFGDHQDHHFGDHAELKFGFHFDVHLGVHQEIHAVAHIDTKIGEVSETWVGGHEETHVGENAQTSVGDKTETAVGVHTDTDAAAYIRETVTKLENAVNVMSTMMMHLDEKTLHMSSLDLAISKSVLRIYN
jgi:hypothetical protein